MFVECGLYSGDYSNVILTNLKNGSLFFSIVTCG